MSARGGCSLRNCSAGTSPTAALAGFASFAEYPVACEPVLPTPPPTPPVSYPGSVFSVVKVSAIGPLLSRQNVTVDGGGITQAFEYEAFEDASDVQFLYTCVLSPAVARAC